MTLSEEIEAAREFCIKAHAGQFRRDGVTPYHTHPMAVADAVPDDLKPAALLHDVVEDSGELQEPWIDKTWAQIVKVFPFRTCASVFAITRWPHWKDYDYYISYGVLMNADAIRIKIADMEHNLNCQPSENSKRKIAKWLPVLKAKDSENDCQKRIQ